MKDEDERMKQDTQADMTGHGYLFIDPSDEPDEGMAAAFQAIGRGSVADRARLAWLEQRITEAAASRLALLRERDSNALDYVAGWARFAIPIAMAASLLLAVAIFHSPLPASLTTTSTVVFSSPSVSTVMLGVLTGSEESHDAAAQLVAEEPGSARAWAEIAR